MTSNPENPQAKAAQDKVKEIQGDAKETTQVAQDKAQELTNKAQETAQTAGKNTQEAAQAATSKAQETAKAAGENAQEAAQAAKGKVQETVEAAKSKVQTGFQAAKESIPDVVPTPPGLKAESSAQDLKARLEGGEPALTIVDVKDREAYNEGHIMGAIPMPMDELVERAQSSLEASRDIYVYGKSDQETAQAATSLRQAGFTNVAELKGGLAAWKKIAGSTEGRAEAQTEPGS